MPSRWRKFVAHILALAFSLMPLAAIGQGFQIPNSIPPNTVLGRSGTGAGPIQPLPMSTITQQLLSSGQLGTFAFQNYATPPAIGGTTPNTGASSGLTDTGISGSTQCVQANSSGVLSGTGSACTTGRILLNTATTFYFSLSVGNDSTGNGTSLNPWRHLQYAYQYVQQHYDVGGQTVTFQSVDSSGTYPDCFIAAGLLTGSPGPFNVIINGNGTTFQPATGSNCSGGNPYVLGAAFGGGYEFENVTMSVCGTWNTVNTGGDMVNIGLFSQLEVGPGVTYGCGFGQWNHNSVNGILIINNGYTIQAKNVTTTGTWSSTGNTIAVTDVTGLEMGFGSLTVGGGNDCLITGSTVTLPGTGAATLTMSRDINATNTTCSFTTSGAGASITFKSGANGHWGIGAAGQVVCATNNVPNTQKIAVQGNPMFFQGFVYALQLSQINCGAEWFVNGNAYGPPFLAQGGSLLCGHGMGLPYWPGSGYNGTLTASLTAGSTNATLSSGSGTFVVNGAGISDSLQATIARQQQAAEV
jgi:hypothetical protein